MSYERIFIMVDACMCISNSYLWLLTSLYIGGMAKYGIARKAYAVGR